MLDTTNAIVGTIVNAIAQLDGVCTIMYRKPNGMIQVRAIQPISIRRCDNGNTVVTAQCVHAKAQGEDAWRSFTLNQIEAAVGGDAITGQTIELADLRR